jgi:hypothetical protein
MNAMTKLVLAGVMALGLAGSATNAAQALDNHYAVVNIRNPTNVTLYYQFRWGENSDWQSFSVGPRSVMTHSYPYDFPNQNRSPTPQIRFHYNPNEAIPRFQVYNLQAYAAPRAHVAFGKPYTFRYTPLGFLDLYEGN